MAKSKNHTNENQNRKAHRNGIKKPKDWQKLPIRGMPKDARLALHEEQKALHPVSKKKLMTFEERMAQENADPAVHRRRLIKKMGIRRMALRGIYLN
ncbi:large subunit ribosomal protein L29e [Nematocida homosporus]|uniref:large subunit ribosomal protein L29e n=1 Tax=Nematocida homosporus TaxID=1912981 RepID=UPI00221FD1E0|nr:large subunit ribosomal protein L29e [Nematocida homosporus]KAI5185204.1 large subunit ribosomal protein L29e [Nematocida homosporus]